MYGLPEKSDCEEVTSRVVAGAIRANGDEKNPERCRTKEAVPFSALISPEAVSFLLREPYQADGSINPEVIKHRNILANLSPLSANTADALISVIRRVIGNDPTSIPAVEYLSPELNRLRLLGEGTPIIPPKVSRSRCRLRRRCGGESNLNCKRTPNPRKFPYIVDQNYSNVFADWRRAPGFALADNDGTATFRKPCGPTKEPSVAWPDDRKVVSACGVRREKAALSSGCKARPATAPAGNEGQPRRFASKTARSMRS